jgi:heme/copper-type cytochrome/quinol oxidase subunit 4
MDLESWTLSFKNRDGSWNPTDVIALVVLVVAAISLVAAIWLMINQAGVR